MRGGSRPAKAGRLRRVRRDGPPARRAYQDILEQQLGDDAFAKMLTEQTDTTRTETRPAMGALAAEERVRQRESLARAIHRAEGRAHTMRTTLWKQLAIHGQGRGKRQNAALVMAELDAAERAAGLGSTG
jgi:hypothetical protein